MLRERYPAIHKDGELHRSLITTAEMECNCRIIGPFLGSVQWQIRGYWLCFTRSDAAEWEVVVCSFRDVSYLVDWKETISGGSCLPQSGIVFLTLNILDCVSIRVAEILISRVRRAYWSSWSRMKTRNPASLQNHRLSWARSKSRLSSPYIPVVTWSPRVIDDGSSATDTSPAAPCIQNQNCDDIGYCPIFWIHPAPHHTNLCIYIPRWLH